MDLISQIIGIESGGNPSARNPNSSAAGLGQFIDSTWLDMIAKHRPDLVQGKSKEEILALKMDPELSRAMTDAYAAQNAATLSQNGFQATPGNTYLAHFAGPQGALKVLSADPNAPISDVLGGNVVKVNPFLAGKSAGDVIAWANRKMAGGAPVPPIQSAQVAQAAPVGAPLNIVAPSAQAAPVSQPMRGQQAPPQDAALMQQMPMMGAPPRRNFQELLAKFQTRQKPGFSLG